MKLIKIMNEDRISEFVSFWCPNKVANDIVTENDHRIGNSIDSDSAKR